MEQVDEVSSLLLLLGNVLESLLQGLYEVPLFVRPTVTRRRGGPGCSLPSCVLCLGLRVLLGVLGELVALPEAPFFGGHGPVALWFSYHF